MLKTWKDFLKEEEGMGTVEIILIIVVLISLVIIFKTQLTKIKSSKLSGLKDKDSSIFSPTFKSLICISGKFAFLNVIDLESNSSKNNYIIQANSVHDEVELNIASVSNANVNKEFYDITRGAVNKGLDYLY